MCAGMWRAEGLRLGAAGVRRGQAGGGEGNVPCGKGSHKVSQLHTHTHTVTGFCQMLTGNYLGSHHSVPTGKTTY